MASLESIFAEGRTIEAMLSDLKTYQKDFEGWEKLNERFNPSKHPIIADPSLRPKVKIKNGKKDVPAKIAYAAEMLVTKRMTQMAFSIPVKRVYEYGNDEAIKLFAEACEAVYNSVRINGVNNKRMYAYFAACEMATFWYVANGVEEHETYGFPSTAKLRCRSYSPMPSRFSNCLQANLWPLFNDDDDLIALSAEYKNQVGGETIHHFDVYSADTIYYFKTTGGKWGMESRPNPARKIPACYICRPEPVYDHISEFRNDIEFTLSRNSDNIKKNSSPIVKISGELKNNELPTGDNAREVYRLEQGGDIGMISPALTTADAITQINTDRRFIEEVSQLPDLSLENVRGLGAVSGEARRNILTDAHLKVEDESHEIILFLDREFSVIKSLLCSIHPEFEKYKNVLKCTHIITPYIMEDESADIDKYIKASGGVVMSRKTAIEKLGIVDDAEAELEQIAKEQQAASMANQLADIFAGAE